MSMYAICWLLLTCELSECVGLRIVMLPKQLRFCIKFIFFSCFFSRQRLRHVRRLFDVCRIRFVATGITGCELMIQIVSDTPPTIIFIRNLTQRVCHGL